MSGTLNKVMLIGNLGDEVKMHYFENGDCIGRFPIATSESYTNKKTGERTSTTEWHNIIVRNKAAEICEKYLGKGDKIYVEGRLRTRQWQDDTGNTRYSTEVLAQDFTFLTPKGDSSANVQQGGQSKDQKGGSTHGDSTNAGATNPGSAKTGSKNAKANNAGATNTETPKTADTKKKSPLSPSEEDDLPF